MRKNRLFLLLLVALSGLNGALAQQQSAIRLEARTSLNEVIEGGRLEVTYAVVGSAEGRLRPPAFAPFRNVGGSQEMTGMQIVNGKVSAHHDWVFTLSAPGPGTYTIPAATATVGQQTLRSEPLTIRVVAAGQTWVKTPKGVPPGVNPDIFVVTEFTSNKVWLGQQVICQVNIYTRRSVESFDLLSLPKVEGAYQQELRRFDTRNRYVKIKGQEYAAKTLYAAAIFPQSAGSLKVTPAQVRALVEQSNSPLGLSSLVLESPAATLQVRDLPPNPPTGFTGGVGQYVWELASDRDSTAVGQALTLRLMVRGNGDPRRFQAPVLMLGDSSLEVTAPRSQAEEQYENGQQMVHSQTLEYVVLPHREGEFVLSPQLVWFNPDSSRYVHWQSPTPIRVKVLPSGSVTNAAPVLPKDNPEAGGGAAWWRSSKGIGAAALLLAGLLVVLFLVLERRKKQEPSVVVKMLPEPIAPPETTTPALPTTPPTAPTAPVTPTVTATTDPFAEARALLNAGAPQRDFYRVLYRILQNELSERYQIPPGALSGAALQNHLLERGVPAYRAADWVSALLVCEQALFAGQDHSAEMEEVLRKVGI